jgi:hypothetical protein
MKKLEKVLIPLGMVGILFYLAHTLLGRILWAEYSPVTMDISSLTADGAPNAGLLRVLTYIYGLLMIAFSLGVVLKAFRKYGALVRAGAIVLLIMELVSMFGYMLFPLSGDKTVMTFGNLMHIIVTITVVLTTIAFGFLMSAGFLKREKLKGLGRFTLVMAILITLTGMTTPIGMGAGWNILGVTERLSIYSVQTMLFGLSAYYTFSAAERNDLAV